MTWNPEKRAYHIAYNRAWRLANPVTRETWAARILPFLKARAKKQGFPFDLTAKDIYVPEVCPALGVTLVFGGRKNHPYGPSVDKLIPRLGYIRGNVAVISTRANMIKHDATAAELRLVAEWAAEQGA